MLDSSGSDLAAGLHLTVDMSDVFMLVDTRAQVVVYVFDEGDIESVDVLKPSVATLRLRSSTFIPQELQTRLLTSRLSSTAGNTWANSYRLMQTNC